MSKDNIEEIIDRATKLLSAFCVDNDYKSKPDKQDDTPCHLNPGRPEIPPKNY